MRRLGVQSLGAVLGVGQCKLLLVPDERAMALYGKRLEKRDERLVRTGAIQIVVSRRFMQKIGAKGGKSRAKMLNERLSIQRRMSKLGKLSARARMKKIKPSRRQDRQAAVIRWERAKAAVKA